MTQLPEPNFIERNPEIITNEWIKLYEEKTGKILQPAQIERLMVDVGAYRETLLRVQIQETAKQNLLSYANIDNIRHIGEPLGVEQLSAKPSKTTLRFYIEEPLDFNLTIPTNTEVETKDGLFVFTTDNEVILLKEQVFIDVNATCESVGTATNNYSLGSINSLITPLSYISKVENITVSSGGSDDEDIENLRERIRQAPEKFSNAGSRGAYRYHTLSAHQSVRDVAIISPSAGVVNIYPLTIDGNPTPEIISIIQDYLSDEKVRPLTDYVQVIAPEKISFSINATVYLYQNADKDSVFETIESKMKEYKNTLSEKLGKDVVRTQIIAILNSVYGVFKVDLKMTNDIEVQEYQWSDLKEWNIEFGGYANE